MILADKLSSVDYIIKSMNLDDGFIVIKTYDGEEQREIRINVEEFV